MAMAPRRHSGQGSVTSLAAGASEGGPSLRAKRCEGGDAVRVELAEGAVRELRGDEDVGDVDALVQGVERRDVAALRAGHDVLDAAAGGDEEAEADRDGAAQAVRRGRRFGEPYPVDARAAAVLRGHGDRDLPDPLQRHLVPVGVLVGVGGLDHDRRAALRRLRLQRRLRHTVGGDALVVGAAGCELADVDAAERQRGEAGVDRVGHVVAVDLVVARVGDVHHRAVRPDATRAVVAGPAEFRELLVAHALEFLGAVARVLLAGARLFIRQHGQAVGEEALRVVVGDPDGDAVGPDAVGVVVGGVEFVLAEQLATHEVVAEEAVLATIKHPHRLVVGPDAARVAIAFGECDVALGEPVPAGEVVREQLLLATVGDPDDRAVGPDTAGCAVALIELELAVLHALAALEVVGVDGIVGALAVLDHPQRRTVGPEAGRAAVAGIEILDVTVDRPLEVLVAGGGAGGAATAADGGQDDRRRGFAGGGFDLRRGLAVADRGGGDDPDGVGHAIREVGDGVGGAAGHHRLGDIGGIGPTAGGFPPLHRVAGDRRATIADIGRAVEPGRQAPGGGLPLQVQGAPSAR